MLKQRPPHHKPDKIEDIQVRLPKQVFGLRVGVQGLLLRELEDALLRVEDLGGELGEELLEEPAVVDALFRVAEGVDEEDHEARADVELGESAEGAEAVVENGGAFDRHFYNRVMELLPLIQNILVKNRHPIIERHQKRQVSQNIDVVPFS